jgi:glucosamine-6-phosphate deaminase
MEIVIRPDADAAAELVARIIAAQLRAQPRLVLGLATGNTMEAVYALLEKMRRTEGLDFSGCRTFNLDEYIGLPADDPHSYRAYMRRHLFERVNISPHNTFLPDGTAADLAAECSHYERLIHDAGGIDIQLLGIGLTGHLGFNEPPSAFDSRTRVIELSPVTREQNAPLFPRAEDVPHQAITVGIGTILDSRRCLLLATGEDKAEIVARALEGPLTTAVPASALKMRTDCTVVLDEAAASRLTDIERYRSEFESGPKWAAFHASPPSRQVAATGGTQV